MTRIAITGASGFAGSHLLPALAAEGHEVHALVRPGSSRAPVAGRPHSGDVRNPEAVRALVEGCDIVVHMASSFAPEDDGPEIVLQGTRNLVEAAREAGVGRIIQLSCLGAEASAHAPLLRAKWEADMMVRASTIPYVVLRPSVILGRGDGVLQPLAALVRALPVIPVPGRGAQRVQPVDVDDLVRCILLSLAGGDLENQMVSVGGPAFLTFRQIVDLVQGRLGMLKSKLVVPPLLLPALSAVLPASARSIFGEARLAMFREGVVASPGIVQREFGFTPASVIQKMGDYL